MAVNANTKYPREALTFLKAVNLDPEVRNLLNYGVEGVHYRLSEEDQVEVISDGYRGVPYTQGNWYILKTMVGEDPDKWEHYREYNRNAEVSSLLGFEADFTGLESEREKVSRVYNRYDNALLTGSVNPVIYRSLALNAMREANINMLRWNLQNQVDEWLGKQPAQTENGGKYE